MVMLVSDLKNTERCCPCRGSYYQGSTKIYNRETGEIMYGRIPPYSVVVPGNLPSKDGTHSLYAAIIIKTVDEKTRSKTGLNDLLRD